MPKITFVKANGEQIEVEGTLRETLMEAARSNDIDEIVAECGGACSCATCHCYIDEAWYDKLPEPDAMELGMLDCVLDKKDTSRLSCQIVLSDETEGMVVKLPAAQY